MANMKELWKSEEFRIRMSEQSRKRWEDPAIRKRMCEGISKSFREKQWTPVELAKKSELSKRIANDPEITKRRVASFKKTCASAAHKEKAILQTQKTVACWKDPEYRKKITDAVRNSWTDERRQKARAMAKLRFENKEFAAKLWRTRIGNRILKSLKDFLIEDEAIRGKSFFKDAFERAFAAHLNFVAKKSVKNTFLEIVQQLNANQPNFEPVCFENQDSLPERTLALATYKRFLNFLSFSFVGAHIEAGCVRIRTGRGRSHAVTRSKMEVLFQQEIDSISGVKSKFLPELGDITFPEKKLVIDIDGDLYHATANWHCSAMTPVTKDYHLYKVAQTKKLGFRPIRFWGHEIETRRTQCINFVLGALNCGRSIGARNCDIQKIPKEEATRLVNLWHIQTYNPSTHVIAFMLIEKATSEPVAVMTFSKHHRQPKSKDKNCVVLSRLAFSPNVNVSGGSEKLLAHAKPILRESFAHIVSWSHNRLSEGKVYSRLGFIEEAIIPPDYHYVGSYSSIILQKQQAKKVLLQKKLNAISATWQETETEEALAAKLKLSRCYDAGKIRWMMKLH